MPRVSVHLLQEPTPTVLAHLRERLRPEITLTVGHEPSPDADFEILVGGRVRAEHLSASPRLRALIIPWSGLQASLRELMRAHAHVAVHNLHHNARPVAELAVALMLAAAKFIVPMDRKLRGGDWTPRYEPNPSLLLQGKRVLILGYGAIGREVSEMCRGLGMRVTGVRRRPDRTPPECPDDIRGLDALPALLPRTDVLILALPLTGKTEGVIGPRELDLLPPRAIVVNVGRGPLVDEAALHEALRTRRIHAAGIDVWYQYPQSTDARAGTMPSTFPFHELDNIVMSPHRAGALGSEESEMMRMEALATSLNAAARGEPIPSPVDLNEGY